MQNEDLHKATSETIEEAKRYLAKAEEELKTINLTNAEEASFDDKVSYNTIWYFLNRSIGASHEGQENINQHFKFENIGNADKCEYCEWT